jgi:hypothetical protein
MTILIQEMSSTVVSAVNRGTFTLADWTVMPKKGVFKEFLDHHPGLREWLAQVYQRREERRRVSQGFALQNPDEDISSGTAVNGNAEKTAGAQEKLISEQTEHHLARELALSIRSVAKDLRADPPKRYAYEEWALFTKLIRFSRLSEEEVAEAEDAEGLVEWDWLGEDSPMLADITEAEWVLDRLCESLHRYTRRQARLMVRTCSPVLASYFRNILPVFLCMLTGDQNGDAWEKPSEKEDETLRDTIGEDGEEEDDELNGGPSTRLPRTMPTAKRPAEGNLIDSIQVSEWAESMRQINSRHRKG